MPTGLRHDTKPAALGPAAPTRYSATPAAGPGSTAPPPAAPPRTATPHPDAREPLQVEVDHGSSSSRGRPAGHVWLVRLRRGDLHVILAVGLGRPSAEHLARQIREVINPPPLATPTQTR